MISEICVYLTSFMKATSRWRLENLEEEEEEDEEEEEGEEKEEEEKE